MIIHLQDTNKPICAICSENDDGTCCMQPIEHEGHFGNIYCKIGTSYPEEEGACKREFCPGFYHKESASYFHDYFGELEDYEEAMEQATGADELWDTETKQFVTQ